MKKTITATILFGTLFSSVLLAGGAHVQAEEEVSEARISALFKITGEPEEPTDPGEEDNGSLAITEHTTVMDLGELESPTDYAEPIVFEGGAVKVEDTTETYEGWTFQVRLSNSETDNWLDGLSVRIQNTTPGAQKNIELGSENVLFHSHASANGENYVREQNVSFSSSVLVPVGIAPGDYHNDIVWTLSAGPN